MARVYRLSSEFSEFTVEVSRDLDERMQTLKLSQEFVDRIAVLCGNPFSATSRRWGFGGALRRDTFTHTNTVRYVASFLDARHRSVAASLDVLTRLFADGLLTEDLSEEERPLVALSGLSFRHGRSGWDMAAEFSETMQRAMLRFDETMYRRIILRMIAVGKVFDENITEGGIHVAEGKFFLQVPGDATQLYSSDHGGEHRGVLKLTGHNIDRPSQQFAFLAGLAEANMIAEELER